MLSYIIMKKAMLYYKPKAVAIMPEPIASAIILCFLSPCKWSQDHH